MAIKRKRSRQDDMEAVPTDAFSDIAFLIIIFFILTTAQITFSGFDTDMPASNEAETEEKTHTLQVKGNQIIFNGDTMEDLEALRKKLIALKLNEEEAEEDKVVMFEVSGDITWEAYYQYMAVISDQGGNVTIVKKKEKK